MLTKEVKQEWYQALLDKNTEYEGIFFVGIITTGIVCIATCPARKPLFKNCEFYQTVQEAIRASYRPCLRCRPLSHPGSASELITVLLDAIEKNPEKRWKDCDFEKISVDASTARRHFKKRFGMTFVEYARARRMGIAMKEIRKGAHVIEAQLTTGYESSSGFRDAFSSIMGAVPTRLNDHPKILSALWIDTPLGPMLAIADEKALYLLEFISRRELEREIERLRIRAQCAIIPGITQPLLSIKRELNAYFSKELQEFKTPLVLLGSSFQKMTWEALMKIPYNETKSYKELATSLGKPTASRAVANANGANQIALVIPCHRIINSNGNLGGYGGGITRKQWLIDHEKRKDS
ncbi:bifunctional transcriptional activator/DNA repair protein Ada [Candidatus Dependentiae bacterium]|nr:bifunctional transcriptional activator/DNA repair protein Ada [Candidatus Dependentiae bacterium]